MSVNFHDNKGRSAKTWSASLTPRVVWFMKSHRDAGRCINAQLMQHTCRVCNFTRSNLAIHCKACKWSPCSETVMLSKTAMLHVNENVFRRRWLSTKAISKFPFHVPTGWQTTFINRSIGCDWSSSWSMLVSLSILCEKTIAHEQSRNEFFFHIVFS